MKKFLLIFLVLLTILILCVMGVVIYIYVDNVDDLTKPVVADKFFSEWQSYLLDETKLNEIVIPGSHDAGSNNMMPLARTQGHDIIDQLNGGVRYLDLRVTDKNNDLVIFHGPIKGQSFSKVLNEIKTFILKHPTEFIILDFQHLGKNVNSKVLESITNTLPMDKSLVKSKFSSIENTTMKDIRDNNINFVIIWNNSEEAEKADYLYYRDDNLKSFYDGDIHKQDTATLIKHFDNYYARYNNKGFFVLQSQKTANLLTDKPSQMEKQSKAQFNNFLTNLPKNQVMINKTNIVMRDFIVSDLNTIRLILSLNIAKNNIKAEMLEQFATYTKIV